MSGSEDGRFEGDGGFEVVYRHWPASGEARAAVVISHGAGEHSGRYQHVAERLGSERYSIYALDHRGHGRSAGPRMRFDSLDPLAADLRTMVGIAAAETPGRRPFLLAHSMGSTVGLHYACDHQDELAGLILSGALASVDQKPHIRFTVRAMAKLAPGIGVFKVDPETVSRDPEVIRDYDSDPLNYHGSFPAASVNALQKVGEEFPDRLPRLTLPLLIMHGGADELTPPSGSRAVDDLASSDDKTLHIYDGLRHEILNEPEQDRVLDEMVAWLNARS